VVAETPVTVERFGIEDLVQRLRALHHDDGDAALVFDGDGTLWSGDVAEDVFHHAVQHDLLRGEALGALEKAARDHGIGSHGSASELAGRIFEAYRQGEFPERTVCEVMAWCFAGYTLGELADLSNEVLALARLDERLHRSLTPIFELARERNIRILIVSASPRFVVELAAARWNVPAVDIAASTPEVVRGRVLPALSGPIPYAETKVDHARELLGHSRWLASFGDSAFDLEMLGAAELAVAVAPKPSLLRRLDEVPGAVVLLG
jgi:phosphoserine phosphatase